MKKTNFLWPVRVYYEDTDSGGVVYYANYLKFMERARTEFLRSLGYQLDQLQDDPGIVFAVHSMHVQYKKPARFNECLSVMTSISSLGRASIRFAQNIFHAELIEEGSALCSAEVKIACVDAEKFSTQPVPSIMLDKIKAEYVCGS